MNRKQWDIFILGILCVIILICSAVLSKPKLQVIGSASERYEKYIKGESKLQAEAVRDMWIGNIFWTVSRRDASQKFNSASFSSLLFTIGGIFAFMMWAFRSKEQKSPGKDFTQKIKELAELKEKGFISEEEFEKGKAKLFGEDG